ncbi:kinase-like domain-containing protein [Rhizophagus irregularis DAOM 181602=DAOM 197198]|nr:kinase-like domain-containing protein [Rhizophagus irregularis DAOM 181602=DAOM 197198]
MRCELITAAINKASALTDFDIHDDIHKIFEFRKKIILADEYLTKIEILEAIKLLNKSYDHDKVLNSEADWINGGYDEWNSKEKQLERKGRHKVILKRLESIESANRSWFEEAKSHLAVSNKWNEIVGCFGLTQDPFNKSYMLVVYLMDMDLRKYLRLNHSKLTWKGRFEIINNIVNALHVIHTPEVIVKMKYSFASDIYSIGMLMWEISSGQPPYANIDHDYYLAMNIVHGMRPKPVLGIPLEYKILMERCWDADPAKRPDINNFSHEIHQILKSYNQNENNEYSTNIYNSQLNLSISPSSGSINSSIRTYLSKTHSFKYLPEPRNATKVEQEAYYSLQNDLSLPDSMYTVNNI